MSKQNIVLIGGGGHCRSCIDVIEETGKFVIKGIVDQAEKLKQKVFDYEIIATDDDLSSLVKTHKYFLVTLGCIKDPLLRINKFEKLKELGAEFPVIVSPLAHIAKSASVGEGTIVMHRSLLNSAAQVGRNCIINTAALIEHDSIVGDHCHISTGSIINGTCKIGKRVFLGSKSLVCNDVSIADDVVVGAGSVVVRDIVEPGVYVGNPARKLNNV